MERERAIADAEALVRAETRGVEQVVVMRTKPDDPNEERPGGWTIVARLQVWHALGITTHIVAVNRETGERRIVKGWVPRQPLERRLEIPDELREEWRRSDERKKALAAVNEPEKR